jgi:hypothetical protein
LIRRFVGTLKAHAAGCGRGLLGLALLAFAACAPVEPVSVAPPPAQPAAVIAVPEVPQPALGEALFRREFAGGYVARTVIEPVRGERRGVSSLRYEVAPKADFDLRQGSIVVSLERLEGPEGFPTPEFDTLFSLLDRQGRQVMTAYATYKASEGNVGEYGGGITIYSSTGAKDTWGLWVPFNQRLDVGRSYELRFAWGPEGNWIFLDGELLKAVYMDFFGREYRKNGGVPFAPLLKDVRLLQIGADAFPRDNSPLDSSRLKSLTIHSR